MPTAWDLEPLWTVEEVAGLTRLARTTIYDKARTGAIPHVKLDGTIRFRPSDIRAWLDRHTHPERMPAGDPSDGAA
jgi:excisionase family DNA binding protein